MKVVLTKGCDNTWVRSLTVWQRAELAALFRQGKHLLDGTDHGGDMRWAQAGCRTRDRFGNWHRTSPTDRNGHERVVINRTSYGYIATGVRRMVGATIDPDTGDWHRAEVWVGVWTWFVEADRSADFPPRG